MDNIPKFVENVNALLEATDDIISGNEESDLLKVKLRGLINFPCSKEMVNEFGKFFIFNNIFRVKKN